MRDSSEKRTAAAKSFKAALDRGWNELPLLVRRAICTHTGNAQDQLRRTEARFIAAAHRQIEEKDADARWEVFQELLSQAAVFFGQTLEKLMQDEGEILVALMKPDTFTQVRADFIGFKIMTDAQRLLDQARDSLPRWLKGASEGEPFSESDLELIEAVQREWSTHNPVNVKDFDLSFETECDTCEAKIRRLSSHLGGASFDIPAGPGPQSGEWARHKCDQNGDRHRARTVVLKRWTLPESWLAWLPAEFRRPGKKIEAGRIISATDKNEITRTSTARVIDVMRHELTITALPILKRQEEAIEHRLAIVAAGAAKEQPKSADSSKKPTLSPLSDKQLASRKQRDCSELFDQAHLTDAQRACASLSWEYGLTVAQTARQLGRNRKTVDEHITAAKKRIDKVKGSTAAKKQRAKLAQG